MPCVINSLFFPKKNQIQTKNSLRTIKKHFTCLVWENPWNLNNLPSEQEHSPVVLSHSPLTQLHCCEQFCPKKLSSHSSSHCGPVRPGGHSTSEAAARATSATSSKERCSIFPRPGDFNSLRWDNNFCRSPRSTRNHRMPRSDAKMRETRALPSSSSPFLHSPIIILYISGLLLIAQHAWVSAGRGSLVFFIMPACGFLGIAMTNFRWIITQLNGGSMRQTQFFEHDAHSLFGRVFLLRPVATHSCCLIVQI